MARLIGQAKTVAFAIHKRYDAAMSKKPRRNPRIVAQGGPKITVSIRLAPNDLATIQEGASAAEETQSDTFTRGALRRAQLAIASKSTRDER